MIKLSKTTIFNTKLRTSLHHLSPRQFACTFTLSSPEFRAPSSIDSPTVPSGVRVSPASSAGVAVTAPFPRISFFACPAEGSPGGAVGESAAPGSTRGSPAGAAPSLPNSQADPLSPILRAHPCPRRSPVPYLCLRRLWNARPLCN